MTRTVNVEAHVVVEYPKENEVITAPHYTLRLATSNETHQVEVSIDGGPWQQARRADGYFWFDWSNFMSGRHEIKAQSKLFDGRVEMAAPRHVRVELPHA